MSVEVEVVEAASPTHTQTTHTRNSSALTVKAPRIIVLDQDVEGALWKSGTGDVCIHYGGDPQTGKRTPEIVTDRAYTHALVSRL